MATSQRCQNVCLALIAVMCCVTIAFSAFVYVTLRSREGRLGTYESIHLILDISQIGKCPESRITRPHLPCFTGPNAYLTRGGNVGPLKCRDDYYEEEGGTNFCDATSSTFHLNGDKYAVVVQSPGIYRLYGQAAFKDKNNGTVHVMLRVNDHNFVHCHQQNVVTGSSGAPYTTCTLNGERRLREGDKVALFVPDGMRTINAFYKTTFWGMVRISD